MNSNLTTIEKRIEKRFEETYKKYCQLEKDNVELRKQLKASQKLSEERRVALERCSPIKEELVWNGIGNEELENCIYCAGWKIYGKHDDNCDYVRLISK